MKRLLKFVSVVSVLMAITVFIYLLFNVDWAESNDDFEEVYATDITISASFRSLTLLSGNSLEFNANPYNITPKNYNMGVEVKILNYLGRDKEGGQFKDNCFKASGLGAYYLRFVVKTGYNTTKHDVIKITSSEEISTQQAITCTLKTKTITINEEINLDNYFTFYNLNNSKSYYMCDNTIINSTIFKPKKVGSYNIKAVIDNGDYLICEQLTLIVNSSDLGIKVYLEPNIPIANNSTIKVDLNKQIVMFSYIVEGITSQLITVEIENKEIVSLISKDSLLIVLKIEKKGLTKITIKPKEKDFTFIFYILVE